MTEYPDIYADGIGVTVGPFGVTVTFQLSQPTVDEGPRMEMNSVTVGRVRMGLELAKALAKGLNEAAAQQATVQQSDATTKH